MAGSEMVSVELMGADNKPFRALYGPWDRETAIQKVHELQKRGLNARLEFTSGCDLRSLMTLPVLYSSAETYRIASGAASPDLLARHNTSFAREGKAKQDARA
jgi:hypothetical protein